MRIAERHLGKRAFGHACVLLGLVIVTTTSGVMTSRASGLRSATSDSQPESGRALPAQVKLDLAPPSTQSAPAAAVPRTQGADQLQAVVGGFNPRLGLPQWLRTIKDTALWSGSDPRAGSVGTLPGGGAYVKTLGAFVDTRVQVYFPGDDLHHATQAWVDLTSVEPSSVPAWLATPVATGGAVAPPLPVQPRRVSDDPAPDTTALHVAIVDDASGQLIYGEEPYARVPQASTTKIATSIVALERAPDLSTRVRVTVSATQMSARDGSSTMGLEPGRSVSLDTLLYGMMLPSGNDAAEQIAIALADSREQYIEWMNQEVAALGLKDTHFVNPSGMDADGHYSSAYDMAMLARYAMRNDAFKQLVSTTRHTGDGFAMHNLNRLLDLYPGVDGVKIGFTDAAQKTIVASATSDGHRVFISLMHSQDLVGDCSRLFDWVWATFSW